MSQPADNVFSVDGRRTRFASNVLVSPRVFLFFLFFHLVCFRHGPQPTCLGQQCQKLRASLPRQAVSAFPDSHLRWSEQTEKDDGPLGRSPSCGWLGARGGRGVEWKLGAEPTLAKSTVSDGCSSRPEPTGGVAVLEADAEGFSGTCQKARSGNPRNACG
ncbi:hypothetical protein LX36DRAFT_301249 [Colletotrichum falcatum]|nr:hypothetical protein LX36DRAFT_301249 [Colletotrichum falcatum]